MASKLEIFNLIYLILILISKSSYSVQVRKFKNSNLTFITKNKLILNTCDENVNFFVLGDWGGSSDNNVTKIQRSVSNLMANMSQRYNVKFQIGVGDNFYDDGVKDVNDYRFDATFEKGFNDSNLVNTPWFHILGNRDYYSNPQAQVDYTAKSNRWILPDYNYTVHVMTQNGRKKLITIVMLDTIKLCGNNRFTPKLIFLNQTEEKLADLYFKNLEENLKEISQSNVSYILISGHFPIVSIGSHGPTSCLKDKLEPLIHKYKVAAYLTGHDHNLQQMTENLQDGSKVEHFLVGAGTETSDNWSYEKKLPKNYKLQFKWPQVEDKKYGGFLFVSANENNMTFDYMKSNNSLLHRVVIQARNLQIKKN